MAPTLNLTDEQIAALLEQATAAPADPTNPQQPTLKYRLGNQSFEAKTAEELQAQLDTAMQQIGTAVQQRIQAATAAPAQPVKATPAADAAPTLDRERYAKLFLEDPLAAAEYVDEIRFGMQKPAQALRAVIQDVGAMEQSMAVQQFLGSAGDYEPTPENFAVLSATMQEYNLPWTAKGMQLAHMQAKASGRIRSADADAGQPQSDASGMIGGRGAPTVPRQSQVSSGTVDADLMARFESLRPDQMKQFLERLQP